MTTSREDFEAWYLTDGEGPERTYSLAHKADAWAGWQAATARAVAICTTTSSHLSTYYGNGYNQSAIDCEKAIRGDE